MMRILFLLAAGFAALGFGPVPAAAAEAPEPPHFDWSFQGPLGHFDRKVLQRGFQVYHEVCSACHAMSELAYRNLSGIGLDGGEIAQIARQAQVQDGPNDQGDMYMRPGRPSDHFVPPFPNDQAARAANGGALPPDLSLIVKAREGGPDYVVALLTGFADQAPKGVEPVEGKYYNRYFPGHWISMPPPLSEGAVTYKDGTPATVEQMAHDVAEFLTWAAEPQLEARKRLGIKVMIFLVVLAGMLYVVKRQVWSKLH